MEVHGRAVNEVDETRKKLTNGRESFLEEGIEIVRRIVLTEVSR